MKIAIILLTCGREEMTRQIIKQNFYNAGMDADCFLVDNGSPAHMHRCIAASYPFRETYRYDKNMGISHAINRGFLMTSGYDAVVTMANDILMPANWLLDMWSPTQWISDTGIVGIHTVESLPPLHPFYPVHPTFCPFGNVLITRNAIKKVGGYNTDFLFYGMNDSDYGYRVTKMGMLNYYIKSEGKPQHIGHDVGEESEYRKMKDAGLNVALSIYNKSIDEYERTGNYYRPIEA